MRLPGRFEWKILGALLVVAALGLGAAAYLLKAALDRVVELTRAHQEEGQASTHRIADRFQHYFDDQKQAFRERTAQLGHNPPPHMADLSMEPDLLRARLLDDGRVIEEWHAPPDVLAQAREAPPTLVEVPGPGDTKRLIELTFGIPQEMYGTYLELRDAIAREEQLDKFQLLAFVNIFKQYLVAFVVILAVTPLLGLFIARRATRRVAVLRDAARRVGEGDLSVRISPAGRDELDDLARAFDRMVAELGEARSRLEYLQKVTAWEEVARRLAHEIKNPLTPIQLAVQELASKYPGDDPQYRKLIASATEILTEEIGAVRRLVDDFSAFAKLPKVERAPVDLGDVVDEFVRAHPEWQDIVRPDRPPAPVAALCDRMLIRRVLANLVENAIQASEGAGRKPEVRITVATGRHGPHIAVDDNGPGVPLADRTRVFDPYMTTKEHGTGLGLAIVRKIAIDHGGDVSVDVAPPPLGGARFVVALSGTGPAPRRPATPGPASAT